MLKRYQSYDRRTFEDRLLIVATNIEEALIQGGAVGGKDYDIKFLFDQARQIMMAQPDCIEEMNMTVGWPV
jgi:hypothetical protein